MLPKNDDDCFWPKAEVLALDDMHSATHESRMMPNSFRTAVLCLATSWLIGCQSEPSTFFRSLDSNQDGFLDLQEWMAYYGPHDHPWENCSGNDFEPADCNEDAMLSWKEYHAYRFRNRYCEGRPIANLYRKPELNSQTEKYELIAPCKLDLDGLSDYSSVGTGVGVASALAEGRLSCSD